MNNCYPNPAVFTVMCAALLAAACGIDQGGVTGPTPMVSAKPLLMVGTVQTPVPLTVNGVELNTTGATILLDSSAGSASALKAGQVVNIVGETLDGNATAQTVTYQEDLRGPVSNIDTVAGTITVLSQVVVVDNTQSVAANVDLSTLSVGDVVEISGLRLSGGGLFATFIETVSGTAQQEIVALAENVDTTSQEFFFGNLGIDYSGAGIINNLPTGMPQNGLPIEVEGQFDAGSNRFVASALNGPAALPSILSSLQVVGLAAQVASDGEPPTLVVTGFAAAVTAISFSLGEVDVAITSTTEFVGGPAAMLNTGVLLRLEATLQANGVVTANRITFL